MIITALMISGYYMKKVFGIILSRISSSHLLVSSLVKVLAKFIFALIHVLWFSMFPVINAMNNVFSSFSVRQEDWVIHSFFPWCSSQGLSLLYSSSIE